MPTAPYRLVAADLFATGAHAAVDAVLAAGLRHQPGDGELLVLRARNAEAAGDFAAASSHWQAACQARPDDAASHWRAGVILLRRLQTLDAAETFLAAAATRFPHDVKIAVEFAWAAETRKDHAEVVRRYQRAHELEPTNTTWVAASAAGLRDLGRFDEADARLAPFLLDAHPTPFLLTVHAWIAHYRGDWPEALRRWTTLKAASPADPVSDWMRARILAEHLGQPAAAEALLNTLVAGHPDDLRFAIEHARIPAFAGNRAASLQRWNDLSRRFPADPTIAAARANAEAQDRIRAMDFALQPSTAGDWATSLQRWEALAQRFPTDPAIAASRGDAELQVQMRAMDQARPNSIDPADNDLAVPRTQSPMTLNQAAPGRDHRHLMLQFESLGVNCEFGLVQRHFGAEPLGLLRWTAIHPEQLAYGLEQRFAGIGDPANVKLNTHSGEYIVAEQRYDILMHTFINENDTKVPPDRLLQQFCRRLRFLRDKLLEDLREGEKIFVYQYPRLLHEAEMTRIEAAIRAIGPGTILFVNDAATGVPSGHVEEIRPGCLLGHIDRLAHDAVWDNISTAAWRTVCQNAARLRGPTQH